MTSDGAEVIRLAENAIYRLPGGVVARIARTGQSVAAAKEVNVARWLEDSGVPAVRVLRNVDQPVQVGGRAVTFWHELPPYEYGTTADVAAALRELHKLAPPETFALPELAPFVRLAQRIEAASTISADDQNWLLDRVAELKQAYNDLPPGLAQCVVHGDAWSGNVVTTTTDNTSVLLDLERCSLGPPEWDLVSTAVSYVTTATIDTKEWNSYCEAYGYDVTTWEGFDILRDIRELRQTTMAVQVAATHPERYADQAAHRLACLRGQNGPRPWSGWRAVP
ncbi:MAG: aminoglycoside phosphotransferase family protein [Pseudonocardiaceae bacterium]